jgi:hypothetical protein
MDNDEERLIVFRRAGARFLKRKQFFQIEITGVRQRRHNSRLHKLRSDVNAPEMTRRLTA